MLFIENLKSRLIEDGFNFEPIIDGQWHKIKEPIRGRYATRLFPNGVILTLMGWDGEYKKVYKEFENGHINGEAGEIDEFVKAQIEETNKIKTAANKKASLEASNILEKETFIPNDKTPLTPYSIRKSLTEFFGALVDKATECTTYIPCRDIDGKLWGCQKIFASGDKTFIKGQKKEETFHLIGEIKDKLIITEGFATGASVYMATNIATAIAFDAGNLKKVALVFRKKYPSLIIIIAGDNDSGLTGQHAAEKAAQAVGGHFTYPESVGKDWNDCLVEKGLPFLQQIFTEFLSSIKNKFDRNKLNYDKVRGLFDSPDPAYDWVVKDLITKGGTASLTGAPKSGKSTLTRKLALCVATGEPFFGRPTTKGKVFYIAVEEKISEVKKHLKDLKATGDEEIYVHAGYTPPQMPEKLREICKRENPSLIICDTFAKVTGCADLNDAVKVNTAMEPFHMIAKEFDCSILFVTHAAKGKTGAESIAGSMALRGAFDCNMLLETSEKNAKKRVFYSEQRYGVDFEPHTVNFDPITRDPVLGVKMAEFVVEAAFDEIISFLRENDEEVSSNNLYREIRGKKAIFLRAIKLGLQKGWLLERKEKNKKFYTLSPTIPIMVDDPY